MNKLLIAVVAAAVSLPATAATKVYGELHASYDKLDADGVESEDNLALNSSLVGIKGSKDIKVGLSAIYQLEWGIDTQNNDLIPAGSKGSPFSNRNQMVGLAGDYGALIIGRYDTPLKTVGRKADLFWSSQLGQNRNITNPGVWDTRADKIIAYQTPKFNGFQGQLAYAFDLGDFNNNSDSNTAVSLNGYYKLGAVKLGAAYEKQELDKSNAKRNAYRLTAAYRKGPIKFVGFYQDEDNDSAVTGDPDASVYGIGASYRIGKGKIKGQYYSRDIDGTDNDPDLIAVGYDHRIAKQTDVYAQYATVSEGQRLGGAGHGDSISSTSGGDSKGISVGIRHKF